MLTKQLIIAVEGTAALGSFWHTIVSDYLDNFIRYFCSTEHSGQKLSNSHVELSLVMFSGHGSYSGSLVQRSGWTKDMDTYLQWLSALPFAGGGFNDAAIAEGLSEVLMMFALPNESQGQNSEVQRHCILIAASNPYPLPTPVYQPHMQKLKKSENAELQGDSHLCDAETLAKSFPQCGVSLSVICPKQLPKLRRIYNAGKHNPRAADPPLENVKNPSFLVLISENFMEALRSGKENPSSNHYLVKTDAITSPPVSSTAPASAPPPANGPIVVRPPISAVHKAPATVKVEPTTITSMPVPTFPYAPVPRATSQAVPALQNPPPLLTSQEFISNNDNAPEMKPFVSTTAPTLRAAGAAANSKILNGVAQARLGGNTSIGGAPMLANMISSSLTSIPPDQAVISSASSGAAPISGSLPVSAAGPVANSAPASLIPSGYNPIMPQPSSNQQGNGSLSQTITSMSQGNLPATQLVQNGNSINQNVMNGSGISNIVSGNGTMLPTPGMSQQGQPAMQPIGLNNGNSVTNMPLNQQTSSTMQSAQSKYVKLWEGDLSGERQGQPVFITRLEGFRNVSASKTLAANWPSVMQIVRLTSLDHMNNKQYFGKADFLVFRAMNQHGFLGQLQEKKLCAVIQLPSQTLLLSVSDKAHRLIGMLFPGDMVVFKPQISSQQQQLQAHLQ